MILVMGLLGLGLYLVVRTAAEQRTHVAPVWQVLGGLVLLGLATALARDLVTRPRDQFLAYLVGAACAPTVTGIVERLAANRRAG
jgi:drug/metabolite transporter (DMT)-like permease